jgi:plasmid maintenance system antidote protein VapI
VYEVRDDVKGVLNTLGKKMTDLSRELQINYDTLNAYLNGRREMPSEISERIEKVITKWADV